MTDRTARTSTMVTTFAMVFALIAVIFVGAGPQAQAATALLPDLRIARLTTIRLDTTTIPGHRLLRYTAQLVNVGVGAFEVRGSRSTTSDSTLSVRQRIYDDAGGFTNRSVSGTYMLWAGDGHNHWHIHDLESGTLVRSLTGAKVGSLAKHGFHLVDDFKFATAIPGAPSSQVYTKCGGSSCNQSALNVYMGVSVGWVDRYNYTTVGQYIDVTGLSSGKYVLTAAVDPSHWFYESNPNNNTASATIRLNADGTITVLSRSGGA